MIEISEEKPIDVTTELYPAVEPGQDAASGAVVAVDSAGRLACDNGSAGFVGGTTDGPVRCQLFVIR